MSSMSESRRLELLCYEEKASQSWRTPPKLTKNQNINWRELINAISDFFNANVLAYVSKASEGGMDGWMH